MKDSGYTSRSCKACTTLYSNAHYSNGHCYNELDIVALNEREKRGVIFDVKLDARCLSLGKLKQHACNLVSSLRDYDIQYQGLSLNDIEYPLDIEG